MYGGLKEIARLEIGYCARMMIEVFVDKLYVKVKWKKYEDFIPRVMKRILYKGMAGTHNSLIASSSDNIKHNG